MEAFPHARQHLVHRLTGLAAYGVAVEQDVLRPALVRIYQPVGIGAAPGLAVGAPVLQGVQHLVLHIPVRSRSVLALQAQRDDHIVAGLHAAYHVIDIGGAEAAHHLIVGIKSDVPVVIPVECLSLNRKRQAQEHQAGKQPHPHFLIFHACHLPTPQGSGYRHSPLPFYPMRSRLHPPHCAPVRRPLPPQSGKTLHRNHRWS